MSGFILPDFKVGMVVVIPTDDIATLTLDKSYVVERVDGEYIYIRNDQDDVLSYKSYLFIEADIYFNLLLYLALIRLFGISSNQL